MYKNEPELLERYNMQDVQLLKNLDEKVDCFKLMIKEATWCNTFMSNFYVSELLDNYILKNAKQKNIICPSKKKQRYKSFHHIDMCNTIPIEFQFMFFHSLFNIW